MGLSVHFSAKHNLHWSSMIYKTRPIRCDVWIVERTERSDQPTDRRTQPVIEVLCRTLKITRVHELFNCIISPLACVSLVCHWFSSILTSIRSPSFSSPRLSWLTVTTQPFWPKIASPSRKRFQAPALLEFSGLFSPSFTRAPNQFGCPRPRGGTTSLSWVIGNSSSFSHYLVATILVFECGCGYVFVGHCVVRLPLCWLIHNFLMNHYRISFSLFTALWVYISAEVFTSFRSHFFSVLIPTFLPRPTHISPPPFPFNLSISGVPVEKYSYYNPATCLVDIGSMAKDLESKVPDNSIVLFHACAHNPTGDYVLCSETGGCLFSEANILEAECLMQYDAVWRVWCSLM